MTHFGTAVRIQQGTDSDWLTTGRYVGEMVNEWAGRSDIVAYVGERGGKEAGAPASFNPASAEVEVNTGVAFGFSTPTQVGDLRERVQQYEFPKATGAIFHEAMHAKFSTWDIPTASIHLTPNEFKAMHLLEESRIERLGAMHFPKNQVFLRSCALEIALADMTADSLTQMSSIRQAANLMGLTCARVDAGVLDDSDIDIVYPVIREVISAEQYEAFRDIWREFQTLHASQVERMYVLARAWEALIVEAQEEGGEQDGEGESEGTPGEGGEGEESKSAFAKAILDALAESAGATAIDSYDELSDQQTQEEYEQEVAEKMSKGEERTKARDKASIVFGGGVGPQEQTTTYSTLQEERSPKPDERTSAVRIAQALERAKYRDRDRVVSGSDVPPGRLRTRALVQGEALRARGLYGTEQPFKRVQHKHVDDPTLTVGVMVDISGSMGSAMQPLASAAWVLSEAVRRVQGRVAMVYYGSDVFATLKPGQHLEKVRVYSAPDGTEMFDEGFQALNGSLNLLDGTGARLLVVVSDGAYTVRQTEATRKWLKRCQQAGVAVLWIGAGRYGNNAQYLTRDSGAKFVLMGKSVTAVANDIGRACADALTAIGSRR